jgi:hypothetical protein
MCPEGSTRSLHLFLLHHVPRQGTVIVAVVVPATVPAAPGPSNGPSVASAVAALPADVSAIIDGSGTGDAASVTAHASRGMVWCCTVELDTRESGSRDERRQTRMTVKSEYCR